LLSGPDRENLWQARRNLARKLHEETVQLDRRDDASPRPDMVPAMVYSTQAIRSEYQQGVHRARLALILLNLGEMGASGAKLESSLEQLKGPKVDSTALAAIGKGIRHIWAEEIPEELRRRLGKKEILAADRLSRILYPLDPGGKEDPAGAALSPTLALRREEAVLLWRWLADFYRQEGRFAGEAGTSGDFYFKAADEYGRQLP
jgi:hypothetical protein